MALNNASNNAQEGVHLFQSTKNYVTGNELNNNDDGVKLYNSSGNTVFANTLKENKKGIYSNYGSTTTRSPR